MENDIKILLEKLPKDLADTRLYSHQINYIYGRDRRVEPRYPNRRNNRFDYENATYKKLTPEDAKEYKKNGELSNLRFVVPISSKLDWFDVIYYNENDKLMNNPNVYTKDGYKPAWKIGFKELCNTAKAIYWTDEINFLDTLDKTDKLVADEFSAAELAKKYDLDAYSIDNKKSKLGLSDTSGYLTRDTGRHAKKSSSLPSYSSYIDYYDLRDPENPDYRYHGNTNPSNKEKLNKLLNVIRWNINYWQNQNETRRVKRLNNYLNALQADIKLDKGDTIYNTQKYIGSRRKLQLLQELSKLSEQKFKNLESEKESNSELKRDIHNTKSNISYYEAQIKKYQERIKEYEDTLKKLEAELENNPEQEQADIISDQKLEEFAEKYLSLFNDIEELKQKLNIKDESLNEDLPDAELEEPIEISTEVEEEIPSDIQDNAFLLEINSAVQQKWDTINHYKSLIATAEAENHPEKARLEEVLNEIIDEEIVLIGMLTKVSELFDTEQIDLMKKGEEKTEEILAEIETPLDENLNK